MNIRGQQDPIALLGVAITAIFALAIIGLIWGAFTGGITKPFTDQISELNAQISQKTDLLAQKDENILILQNEIQDLKNTQITKDDITAMKSDLNMAVFLANQTNNNYYDVKQEFNKISTTYNWIFNITIILAIEFAFISIGIFDLTIGKLKITKNVISFIESRREKHTHTTIHTETHLHVEEHPKHKQEQ